MVVCRDEMGPLATLPRGGRSWGRKPARRSGRDHKSKTFQRLAAFAPRTGQGIGFPNSHKTGEDVLGFLQNTLLPRYRTHGKIYLVGDNFSAPRRALNWWRPRPDHFEFVWTPTHASWLNLIEPWFLVLEKTALQNTDLKTTEAIAEHLQDRIGGGRRSQYSVTYESHH
jgi:hypothetical protein